MDRLNIFLPEDCAKKWEILLILLSSEEKNLDRTGETEVEIMKSYARDEGVKNILLDWLNQMHVTYAKKISDSDTALKCDDVSMLWRQRGNDKFRANLLNESYKCYAMSVLYAPQNTTIFALAVANRSAALFRMQRYKECLDDIAIALSNRYPNNLRHKLLLRRGDCHVKLQQPGPARQALAMASEHARSLKLGPVHRSDFERHLKELHANLESMIYDPVEIQPDMVIPQLHKGENEHFNAASQVAELRKSEAGGRHVITTEAVRRGDVIFFERPYAWVTLPIDSPVCEMCCAMDVNCLPCSRCSRSVYCGEDCRARGIDIFHRWECSGSSAQIFATIGIAHLALRVLLVSAHDAFPVVPFPLCPETAAGLFECYSEVNNMIIYKRDIHPFFRMFNLITNFKKMNNADYIQYALTAEMLTLYLEHFTPFFDYLETRIPYTLSREELRLFASSLLLRSIGQLICNGHAALTLATVDSDQGSPGRTQTEIEVRRGTAIYPSAAMMNHSCDPNIVNTFHNNCLIVRCARDLPAGSEILNCYGPHKSREPTTHRRAQLRAQYMFDCMCEPCVDQDRKDFVLTFTAYACQACKGAVVWNGRSQCTHCGAEFSLDRALAAVERADELLSQADQSMSLRTKCEKSEASLRVRQQVWHKYHTALRVAADHLAKLYAQAGEFHKCSDLIKQNIKSLEYQYGSFSVEVAHEVRKLADVMLERVAHLREFESDEYREWCLETHKIIKKSIQLMDLHYGEWEPVVKRLREQETSVATLLAGRALPFPAVNSVHHNLHYNLKI